MACAAVAAPDVAGFFVAVVPLCELDFGAVAGAGVCASAANPTANDAAATNPYFLNLENWTVDFEVLFVISFLLSVCFGSKPEFGLLLFSAQLFAFPLDVTHQPQSILAENLLYVTFRVAFLQ